MDNSREGSSRLRQPQASPTPSPDWARQAWGVAGKGGRKKTEPTSSRGTAPSSSVSHPIITEPHLRAKEHLSLCVFVCTRITRAFSLSHIPVLTAVQFHSIQCERQRDEGIFISFLPPEDSKWKSNELLALLPTTYTCKYVRTPKARPP